MQITDKIAIVTGASSGIGLATAILLSKKGAKVVLAARSKEKLEEIAKQLPNSLVVPTDMTKEEEVKELVAKAKEHFGRIDILVNNAGRGYDAMIAEINVQTFYDLFTLDLVGPLLAMQQVIPMMQAQKDGVIINISSGTALMTLPSMAAYSSLKRALVGLSLTAREELKDDNISVSVVYPYITATDFEKNTIKQDNQPEWHPEDSSNDRPMRPADSPEYIAEKIVAGIISGEAEIYAHDWMKQMKS